GNLLGLVRYTFHSSVLDLEHLCCDSDIKSVIRLHKTMPYEQILENAIVHDIHHCQSLIHIGQAASLYMNATEQSLSLTILKACKYHSRYIRLLRMENRCLFQFQARIV